MNTIRSPYGRNPQGGPFPPGRDCTIFNKLKFFLKAFAGSVCPVLAAPVYFGRHPTQVPEGSIIFWPCRTNLLCCGFAGMVAFKSKKSSQMPLETEAFRQIVDQIRVKCLAGCRQNGLAIRACYLGGDDLLNGFLEKVRMLKREHRFYEIFNSPEIQKNLAAVAEHLGRIIAAEEIILEKETGRLNSQEVRVIAVRIEILKDVRWCLGEEVLLNIAKLKELTHAGHQPPSHSAFGIFKEINTVLNSIDRLEVRGRDSAGFSVMVALARPEFDLFRSQLEKKALLDELVRRSSQAVLLNGGIDIREPDGRHDDRAAAITLTYKVAAEIGRLGDNTSFLRRQIRDDLILQELAAVDGIHHTVLAHTRWASVGAISQANCHPVDNHVVGDRTPKKGCIHVCLNGDIDNFQDLKAVHERNGNCIHEEITTDTKIIPLQIQTYLNAGLSVAEAFRRAVNDFSGSHAIAMHTDLCPGSIFLAQRGSGQAVFIGLAPDGYMPASEAYGFIEETPAYVRMNGERGGRGRDDDARGQIFILSQESAGRLEGIQAMYYDGTALSLTEADIKDTELTTRDTDRQGFSHYFLKEISESPVSVEKTLQSRWKMKDAEEGSCEVVLDEKTFPIALETAFVEDKIRRVLFVGQGTAGVAALACADIFRHYLGHAHITVNALKSSELSGFGMAEDATPGVMADALVIAVTQSGTTTDTNRAVEMVKERGAHTLAIVNRRDSDITFRVDGVMYTSSGRDIEMSVASTKAFYSQVVAGALLGLHIARLGKRRSEAFLSDELKQLLELPAHMRKVLAKRADIAKSAARQAVAQTYWAAVGSGPNKAAADEIRIKLSELCYKTISSDYIEDKKHIDLSSEPLIIVCAAGSRGAVIGDIIKDTAIFQAHRATPIVIADEGENGFAPYAADVFHVPVVRAHLAPILNTLAGHLWGYYAALAINEGSELLYRFREALKKMVDDFAAKGLDAYETVLENSFREKIAQFYAEFKKQKDQNRFHGALGIESAMDLTLVLKYLSGRLPATDFDLDFGKKGTAANMLTALFECLTAAVNSMARPVDAIKHQAKTVTVGTSRLSEKLEGILFEALRAHNFNAAHLTNSNILVLKNLQRVVAGIKGAILYRVSGLNLLGALTEQTKIEIIKKEGMLASIPSRVEIDHILKGTKRIIVRQGNVYIGRGRKDDRSIIVIPLVSTGPAISGVIEYLLLLHISFKEFIPLPVKIKALGGKFEHIKNIVQENSISWKDHYLDLIATENIFGFSAEKIAESIVSEINGNIALQESKRNKSLARSA